ncbi:MAG: Gldg family protein [Oscillospiraceae bacterium]|nr:Gldg family protein [Oscillospiraceae bacterium]
MGKKDDIKKKNLGSAKDAADAVKDKAEDILDAAADKAEEITDAVKDKAEEITDAVKDKAEDVIEAAEDTAEKAADAVKEKAEKLKDAAEDAAEDAEASEKKPKKHQRTPEAERERALNKVKRRKKLKYGTLATIITLVVIAAVVMVNVIVFKLDKRYNWNIDLTSKGVYQIDEQTADYLHQIKDDIRMVMLADEAQFDDYKELKVLSETLKRFETESNGKITLEYIDPTKHPEVQNLYLQNTNETATTGSVIVKCGELVRLVPYTDLLTIDSDYDYTTGQQKSETKFIGEQSLISAIIGVTDLHPVKVGLINKTGGQALYSQNEVYCYQRLSELLKKNNFETTDIDIANDEISSDYDFVILCSPCNDLTEAQVKKLSDYLNNDGKCGKSMVYFATPFVLTEQKNLGNFLAEWGVAVENAVVVETDENKGQIVNTSLQQLPMGGVPVVTYNPDALLNANYKPSAVPIVTPYHCSIRTLFEENSGRNTYPLLTTSETAAMMPLDATAESFSMDTAEKGVFNIAVETDMNFIAGGETFKSRLVTFGSPLFVDYFIGGSSTSYDNSNYFITLLNTMCGKDNVITIASKTLDPDKITITEAQAKLIRTITVFVFPAVVALIGILVYIRRRNR